MAWIWDMDLFFVCPLVKITTFSSVQFSSFTQSYSTLCNPMNRSTPALPVHHQVPEFTQTHLHRVTDAIQPSHPLSSPSPPAPNPSQHQSLFQWDNSPSPAGLWAPRIGTEPGSLRRGCSFSWSHDHTHPGFSPTGEWVQPTFWDVPFLHKWANSFCSGLMNVNL